MANTIDTSAPEAARFPDVFNDQILAGDVGPRFDCGEVDALAGMLRALGADTAAAAWIEGHSWGDDDVDDSTDAPTRVRRHDRTYSARCRTRRPVAGDASRGAAEPTQRAGSLADPDIILCYRRNHRP